MLCEAVSFSGVFVPGVFVRFLMPAGCTSRGISRASCLRQWQGLTHPVP